MHSKFTQTFNKIKQIVYKQRFLLPGNSPKFDSLCCNINNIPGGVKGFITKVPGDELYFITQFTISLAMN